MNYSEEMYQMSQVDFESTVDALSLSHLSLSQNVSIYPQFEPDYFDFDFRF